MTNGQHSNTLRQAINIGTFTVAGFSLTAMVMTAAQAGLYRFFDFEGTQNPIELVRRYELLVRWAAHPLAALAGGLVIAMAKFPAMASALALIAVVSPLFVSWLVFADFAISNAVQCALYLVIAAIPTVVLRRIRPQHR